MANDYQSFKKNIHGFTGINLECYKEEQMKRRLNSLIVRRGYGDFDEYFQRIKSDKEVYDEFLSYMTINVSEFYRNPDQWNILEYEILPELLSSHGGNITIWSAACSTGDEPYSLAMLMAKYVDISRIKILATDIDGQILDKAKMGIYAATSLKHLPSEFVDKYFEKLNDSTYKICDKIKSCVEFRKHNLLSDPYPNNIDLLVCRNVLIYFTEDAKNEVYRKFYNALSKKSVLFIGSTEQVMKYRDIGFEIYRSFFYKKSV